MINKKIIICTYVVFYLIMECLFFGVMYLKSNDESIRNYSFLGQINVEPFSDRTYYSNLHKPIIVKNAQKTPIAIFGCSFCYGSEKNLFAKELSKLTGRSVYNYAVEATGPQMMYYAIEKGTIPQNIDTFIYVYIGEHEARSCKFRCAPLLNYVSPRYNLTKNNELKIEYPNWWKRNSFIYRAWSHVYPNFQQSQKYVNELFYEVVMQSYMRLKQEKRDINFIILDYSDKGNQDFTYINKFLQAGVKIVNVNELTGKDLFQQKYQFSETDPHPNERAWEIITESLVKKYDFLK